MDIDYNLKSIINKLESLGYQTVIVGGAVRNHLLGLMINDYDLASAASFKVISQVFSESEIIYRDKTPWAIKVIHHGFKCEISTFRTESDYQNRIPKKITLNKSFKEDVLRRDFTINAIGYSLNKGYLDYVGGLDDLENKLVRVIGDPYTRFIEDPMRILRALRLASTLNFTIEKDSLEIINKFRHIALKQESDHLNIELKKIIAGSNFDYVYKVVSGIFNDISNGQYRNIEVDDRSILLDDQVLYVYLRYKLEIALDNPIFEYLSLLNKQNSKIEKLDSVIKLLTSKVDYRKFVLTLIEHGKNNLELIIHLMETLKIIPQENLDLYNKIISEGYLKTNEVLIKPEDISDKLSIKEKYQLIQRLQIKIILGEVCNNKEALLSEIKLIMKKDKS